jgi:hypothetical protein
MQKIRLVMLLCTVAVVAHNGQAQNCKTTSASETAVVDALRTLYAGATVDDMAKMHSVTAPSFYAFDGGAQYSNIDDLMKVVKKQQDEGVKYVWSVTKPQVTIHCNDAWITYVNEGSVQKPGGGPLRAQWLESAVLQRQQGVWKIVFFQSTNVSLPAQK